MSGIRPYLFFCDRLISFSIMSSRSTRVVANERFLHPRGKSHSVVVCDPFNVLLYLICIQYVEDYCIHVHQGNWYEFFFLYCICLALLSQFFCKFKKQNLGLEKLPKNIGLVSGRAHVYIFRIPACIRFLLLL